MLRLEAPSIPERALACSRAMRELENIALNAEDEPENLVHDDLDQERAYRLIGDIIEEALVDEAAEEEAPVEAAEIIEEAVVVAEAAEEEEDPEYVEEVRRIVELGIFVPPDVDIHREWQRFAQERMEAERGDRAGAEPPGLEIETEPAVTSDTESDGECSSMDDESDPPSPAPLPPPSSPTRDEPGPSRNHFIINDRSSSGERCLSDAIAPLWFRNTNSQHSAEPYTFMGEQISPRVRVNNMTAEEMRESQDGSLTVNQLLMFLGFPGDSSDEEN